MDILAGPGIFIKFVCRREEKIKIKKMHDQTYNLNKIRTLHILI